MASKAHINKLGGMTFSIYAFATLDEMYGVKDKLSSDPVSSP